MNKLNYFIFNAICLAMLACKSSPDQAVKSVPDVRFQPESSGIPNPIQPFPDERGVHVKVIKVFDGTSVVSFGIPVAKGLVRTLSTLQIRRAGTQEQVRAQVKELLADYDANGDKSGIRAFLVQIPVGELGNGELEISWKGGKGFPANPIVPFQEVSFPSPHVVRIAVREVKTVDGKSSLVEAKTQDLVAFTGREPAYQAIFPEGYLATSGILGEQVSASQARASQFKGIQFFSEALLPFAKASLFQIPYAANPSSLPPPIPQDPALDSPSEAYEGWLYDRCATLLTAYIHTADPEMRRAALRACQYYGSLIAISGEKTGTFTGKREADPKYSHSRGLLAYYALTGDEMALNAARAIGEMWLMDNEFVQPYANGALRGSDKQWTERLLGTSLEGLFYAFRMTGDKKYLDVFRRLLDTAYRHITGDGKELAKINPWNRFPPQNCFIHNAEQHGEGDENQPWCSSWMSELMIDALLRYQEQSNDPRVDEIFIRLTRFLRDTGSSYFLGDIRTDSFYKPSDCYDSNSEDSRMLVPLYGSGVDAAGVRRNYGEYDDIEHCPDATALVAAGLRGLKRRNELDKKGPFGPFATEGQSFLALYHEFASCSAKVFMDHIRTKRDPANWQPEKLATLGSDGIDKNKIGYPVYDVNPQRKLGWWFNMSMLQFGLLGDAKIAIPALMPGAIQPSRCP